METSQSATIQSKFSCSTSLAHASYTAINSHEPKYGNKSTFLPVGAPATTSNGTFPKPFLQPFREPKNLTLTIDRWTNLSPENKYKRIQSYQPLYTNRLEPPQT
jgi:hypothetical protein